MQCLLKLEGKEEKKRKARRRIHLFMALSSAEIESVLLFLSLHVSFKK